MNNDLLLSYAVNTVSCLMSKARAAVLFESRRSFVVQDNHAFAGDFWRFLFRHEDRRLCMLDPEARPDGTFAPAEACGRHSSTGRLYAALAFVNERDCVEYALQFNAKSVSAEPDVEVEAMPGGGFAVRWSGGAERKASVLNALVSFAIENGFSVMPEMEV